MIDAGRAPFGLDFRWPLASWVLIGARGPMDYLTAIDPSWHPEERWIVSGDTPASLELAIGVLGTLHGRPIVNRQFWTHVRTAHDLFDDAARMGERCAGVLLHASGTTERFYCR